MNIRPTTDLTQSDYHDLVSFCDTLIDKIEGNENHRLEPLMNMIGDYIKEYEDVLLGDISISLANLDVDYKNFYGAVENESDAEKTGHISGTLRVGDEDSYDFVGYYSFYTKKLVMNNPIENHVFWVDLDTYQRVVNHSHNLFSDFVEHIFRTKSYELCETTLDKLIDYVENLRDLYGENE